MTELTHTLPATLARARAAKRLSQLELALRLDVSQRHVSFVETGRAKPSRELLGAWLQALDAPLATQNAALLQAGFAPLYGQSKLSDPVLGPASQALQALLAAHDPQPALLLDAAWNVLALNHGAQWLVAELMPELSASMASLPPDSAPQTINMLDLLSHPLGLTAKMSNLAEVGPALLAHAREAADALPTLRPKLEAFAALLNNKLGQRTVHANWPRQAQPVLTTRFDTAWGELAFFSMFSTFGTPQDITLASLRVEHVFAADAHTQEVVQRCVKIASTAA